MYPNKKLMSLKSAESTSGIILYSKFLPDMSIEVHPIMEGFWPKIYTNFKADINEWNAEQCRNLYISTLDSNNNTPTYPFYLFFYHLDNPSQNMLDHLILNELAGKIIMGKKYLDEDTVELIHDDPAIPPHYHEELISQVYKKCRQHAHSGQVYQRRGRGARRNRGGPNRGGRQ
uniref:Uncharacterized protein n=2 Tax=Meloidogyne TaxID=189290 RepID=A0A6V7UAK2_MELEN|nr:unnamed protein product [Meloidogyne enterolobii]